MSYAPTFGQDTSGNVLAFLPVGGGILWGQVPGFLAAYSVSAAPTPTATTSTVTNTVTSTISGAPAGIDPTTFYAVAGLLVVFIIATGFFATRSRKPAS